MDPRMPGKPRGKRAELTAWLERMRPEQAGEREWDQLRRVLEPISESYLRRLLRDSGVPLAPMIAGVRQGSLDELEASLLTLLAEYEQGDAARRAAVRRLVITAKEHARWAARRSSAPADKEEMTLWMVTWLENPLLFPEWVKLRRGRLQGSDSHSQT
jgi:hypothetical protein